MAVAIVDGNEIYSTICWYSMTLCTPIYDRVDYCIAAYSECSGFALAKNGTVSSPLTFTPSDSVVLI